MAHPSACLKRWYLIFDIWNIETQSYAEQFTNCSCCRTDTPDAVWGFSCDFKELEEFTGQRRPFRKLHTAELKPLKEQTDRGGSDTDAAPVCRGKESWVKTKLSIYRSIYDPCTHLWSWALGSDQKNEITDTRVRNKLPLKSGCLSRLRSIITLWHVFIYLVDFGSF